MLYFHFISGLTSCHKYTTVVIIIPLLLQYSVAQNHLIKTQKSSLNLFSYAVISNMYVYSHYAKYITEMLFYTFLYNNRPYLNKKY